MRKVSPGCNLRSKLAPCYAIGGLRSVSLDGRGGCSTSVRYFGGSGMRFMFDEGKAAQAAALLIGLHGGRINYMALLKLLYLADRRALIETGYPITGDHMVSMPHGPVLSRIYGRISTGAPPIGQSVWHKWISDPVRYEVEARGEVPDDRLSRYEIATLHAIHDRFGAMDQWALRDLTHELPEWEDPGGSSHPIRPERILESAGKSAAEIEQIRSTAEGVWYSHRMLAADHVTS